MFISNILLTTFLVTGGEFTLEDIPLEQTPYMVTVTQDKESSDSEMTSVITGIPLEETSHNMVTVNQSPLALIRLGCSCGTLIIKVYEVIKEIFKPKYQCSKITEGTGLVNDKIVLCYYISYCTQTASYQQSTEMKFYKYEDAVNWWAENCTEM